MNDDQAKRVREFLARVCDALDSRDAGSRWPRWKSTPTKALTGPLLVGVAVSVGGCPHPEGVKYAGPPPPAPPDEAPVLGTPPGTGAVPPAEQPPPATFPGASDAPPAETVPAPDPTDPPDPGPPDMVVKYGAPPPIDAVPKYGIPIESLPVEPPTSEPLPGGPPPPGAIQTRYAIPY